MGTHWEVGSTGELGPNGSWGWGPNGKWDPLGMGTHWELGSTGELGPNGDPLGSGEPWGRSHLHHDVLHVVVLLGVQEGGELLLGGRHVAVAVRHLEAPLVAHHHLLVVEAVVGIGVVCGVAPINSN